MDGEILDAVTEWGTRSVADGVSGLYDLADADFSGAVTNGDAWAFFLNGRVVGVFDGAIEDFDDALTAYTAPDISLPLLYAMQERGGETRGQYYSNETPLTEIDDTLASGNFVGYVELSENVLSGDYYVVYYGGRSFPVAFVGNSRRRLTGDEAFERAADEVGIYSVVTADVEVVDLPERPESDETTAAAVAGGDTDAESETDTGAGGDVDADAADMVDIDADTDTVDDTPGSDQAMPGVAADVGADGVHADETPHQDDVSMDDASPEDGERSDDAASNGADDEPEVDADESTSTADIDRLRRELETARAAKQEAEAARDRIADERDDYREEVERLRDRVESLEAEIERLEAESAADVPEQTLDPDEALAGTNLFVRYEDKASGTVERAAEGRISESELRDNLRLDYHTEFETAGVRVAGQSFETFLRETPEHRFVEWLLSSLTYEIRRTDTRAGLSKLYEAIERIDRIDLDGEVSVGGDDPESEVRAISFDVVFRDKMGDPLFVASFEDGREPTPAGSIESLLDRAQSVSEAETSFAAAFFVTTSFFDADAMEVAVDATRGGLFSRSSRRSYVKLSRKSGFHLCLVEARDEDFFLTVPDL